MKTILTTLLAIIGIATVCEARPQIRFQGVYVYTPAPVYYYSPPVYYYPTPPAVEYYNPPRYYVPPTYHTTPSTGFGIIIKTK